MNKQLQEINDEYLKVEMYLNLSPEQVLHLSEEELNATQDKREEAIKVYRVVVERFIEIAPSLLSSEVIEAYEQAGQTLKAHLTGHMYHHFNEVYIPVMIKAINNDDGDHLYLFLNALSQRLNKEQLSPIALKALEGKSQRTRRTALEIIQDLSLKQALPKIKLMVNDNNPGVAKFAQEIVLLFEV